MATRWRSSEERRPAGCARHAARARAARFGRLAGILLLAGCITTVTQSYLPDASRDRFSLAEAQDALDQMVAVECPRLVKAQHDLGDAKISVAVDGSGNVTQSTLSKPFGDERMNKIFGGVTAQMHFDAPADGKPATGHMRVGYSCGPSSSTATIQLL